MADSLQTRLAQAEAEIAALREQNERLRAAAKTREIVLDTYALHIETRDALLRGRNADAERYAYLRDRPLDTVHRGGVFAGMTPQNVVLNGDDLDEAIDAAIDAARKDQSNG